MSKGPINHHKAAAMGHKPNKNGCEMPTKVSKAK